MESETIEKRLARLERSNALLKCSTALLICVLIAAAVQDSRPASSGSDTNREKDAVFGRVYADSIVLRDKAGAPRIVLGQSKNVGIKNATAFGVSFAADDGLTRLQLGAYGAKSGISLMKKDGTQVCDLALLEGINSDDDFVCLTLVDKGYQSEMFPNSYWLSEPFAPAKPNESFESAAERLKKNKTWFSLQAGPHGSSLTLHDNMGREVIDLSSPESGPTITLSDSDKRIRAVLGAAGLTDSLGGKSTLPPSSLTFFDKEGNLLQKLPQQR